MRHPKSDITVHTGSAQGLPSRARWIAAGSMAALMLITMIIAGLGAMAAPAPSPDRAILHVGMPNGTEARSTAIFLTGPAGWTAEHAARAKRLAELHTLVIGLDARTLLTRAGVTCAGLADNVADLAAEVQSRAGAFPRAPVLTALSDTAGLALALAAARPDRFKGLVTDGYATAGGPCAIGNLAELGGKAPLRWLDVVAPGADSAASGLAGVKIVEAKAGPRTAFFRSYLGVAGTDSSFDVTTGTAAAGLRDLPLTIHAAPATGSGDTYAIFLSGDGGWARFDEEVANRLAAADIPVVGISALRYMWRQKPPDQVARDITRIDAHFRDRFGRDRVLLIGFSLGANTMAFAGQRLTGDLTRRIAGIGLIAPETRTGFEIVVGGWLGRESGAHEVAPAIAALAARIGAQRIACLHGTKETASACPRLPHLPMQSIAFEGGHHLGKAYDRIAAALSNLALRDLARPDRHQSAATRPSVHGG